MRVNWFLPFSNLSTIFCSTFSQFLSPNPYIIQRSPRILGVLRCLQLIPFLERKGIRCTINCVNKSSDIAIFVRCQNKDTLNILERQRSLGAKTIFDINVNYFDDSGLFPGGYGTTPEQVADAKNMAITADAITCASDFIKDRASQFNSNSFYIPDSVNLHHFRYNKTEEDFRSPGLSAIWSGQPTKADELVGLTKLLSQHDVPLTIISENQPPRLKHSNFSPWSYFSFPRTILHGNISVSPRRTDNSYDLGHSHFKIGVFMAQGVPVLASPLPSYTELLTDTGGGRICRSDTDWKTSIEEIMDDRDLLWKWSQAAYSGMRKFSTEKISDVYVKLFKKLVSNKI